MTQDSGAQIAPASGELELAGICGEHGGPDVGQRRAHGQLSEARQQVHLRHHACHALPDFRECRRHAHNLPI